MRGVNLVLGLLLALLIVSVLSVVFIKSANSSRGLSTKFFNAFSDFGASCHQLNGECYSREQDDYPNNGLWDGCPSSAKYALNNRGCNEPLTSKSSPSYAYCCTAERPVSCELVGVRKCVGKLEDGCDQDCGVNGELCKRWGCYSDDELCVCKDNDTCTGCDKQNCVGRPGRVCEEYPACCGLSGDRSDYVDCSVNYPNRVEELNSSCDDGEVCCQI